MPRKAASPLRDALHAYQSKRNFAITPEPRDGGDAIANAHLFVVQKHWASSLHYDFRLELDGTLKSWAVPKGPSVDPKVKRMAVQVEDHPIAYASFEGTVPPKQYGSGKVIVWDTGTWTPLGDPNEGLAQGNLKFELHGHKLHGKWVLVRMHGNAEKQAAWLLIKEKDAFVRASADYSVVDALPDSVTSLPRRDLPPPAVPATLPDTLAPQLATLAAGPPANAEGWLYEIKFDGYRLLARVDTSGTKLFTRNGHDWTAKLRPLLQAIEQLKLPPGWYDGEIVVPDAHGIPDFGALQQAFDDAIPGSDTTGDVVFYLFDLPFFDGHDLRAAPLDARRAVLKRVLEVSPSEQVRFSEEFEAPAQSVVASACKLGLEGIIAKRRDGRYQSSRSTDWIKLKCSQRQEFVIGGYTDPQGARSDIGALLLGVHDAKGVLQYAGNVGTGFNEHTLAQLKKALTALARPASPFAAAADIAGKPHWVDATLVAEVSFGGWTRSGRVRHAVFRGLRSDKPASAIVRERPVAPDAATPAQPSPQSLPGGVPSGLPSGLPNGLRVTNPQRVIDASSGITKIDVVRYYAKVGELMIQHLNGRPVSLVRAPDGVAGPLFFQKHAETEKLPGIRQLDPALYISHPPLLEVASKQGLLSAAQWNVIEFHTMNTGTVSLEHPDRMVFDLDPGEGVAWVQVQEAAQLVRALLTQLGLPVFLKTSGGKGLHLVVPIRKLHDWDTVKGFSQAIVQHMAQTIPQRFVAKSGPKNRSGKIFIDYLRNGLGATTACAWSARARPGLGISVPVDWSELLALRGGDHWTVKTVHERLSVGNTPWKAYARSARGLATAMSTLGYAPAQG